MVIVGRLIADVMHNAYKSDVFSLGYTMLEMALEDQAKSGKGLDSMGRRSSEKWEAGKSVFPGVEGGNSRNDENERGKQA